MGGEKKVVGGGARERLCCAFWVKEPQLFFLSSTLFFLSPHLPISPRLTLLTDPWPIISCPLPPLPHYPHTLMPFPGLISSSELFAFLFHLLVNHCPSL